MPDNNTINQAQEKPVKKAGPFKRWTEAHAELWKFIKFTFAGASSSVVELIVNTICVSWIFISLTTAPDSGVLGYICNLLKLDNMGVFYSYMISTTVGYTIAFIINRKVTFKAASNKALSITLYILMVVFTIFANAFIGVYLTKFFNTFWGQSVIRDMVIKAIGMAIPTLWTYPLNRFVIQRRSKASYVPGYLSNKQIRQLPQEQRAQAKEDNKRIFAEYKIAEKERIASEKAAAKLEKSQGKSK